MVMVALAKGLKKKRPDLFPEKEEPKPKPKPIPQPTAPAPAPKSQIIREQEEDQDTGKITGITTPEGNTFFGNPRDIQAIAEKQRQKYEAPQGTTEAAQTAYAQQLRAFGMQQAQQQAGLAAQPITQPNAQSINYLQAAAEGISAAAIPAAITAATAPTGVGLAAGLTATGTAFLAGFRSSMQQQISEGITAKTRELSEIETNMKKATQDLNAGGNAAIDVTYFYQMFTQARKNEAQIIADVQSVLATAAGEEGTIELAKYNSFFAYTFPYLENELNQAIMNPDPNKILLTAEEMQS